jgi:hypothetical protein
LTEVDESRFGPPGGFIDPSSGILDGWVAAGGDKDSRWTWDQSVTLITFLTRLMTV